MESNPPEGLEVEDEHSHYHDDEVLYRSEDEEEEEEDEEETRGTCSEISDVRAMTASLHPDVQRRTLPSPISTITTTISSPHHLSNNNRNTTNNRTTVVMVKESMSSDRVPSLSKRLLEELSAETHECVICSEPIRRGQFVWHCLDGCFTVLHLSCIRAWYYHLKQPQTETSFSSPPLPDGGGTRDHTWGNCHYADPTTSSTTTCFSGGGGGGGGGGNHYGEQGRNSDRDGNGVCGQGSPWNTNAPAFTPSWMQVAPTTTTSIRGGGGGGSTGTITMMTMMKETFDNAHCPVCRRLVDRERLVNFFCYCGKVVDPTPDPLLLVGTCGSTCERVRGAYCPHKCPERCHPGPCPPCERWREITCYCGRGREHNENYTNNNHRATAAITGTAPCTSAAWLHQGETSEMTSEGWKKEEDASHISPSAPPSSFSSFSSSSTSPHRRLVACGSDVQHFSCGLPCGRVLDCGRHYCPLPCHRLASSSPSHPHHNKNSTSASGALSGESGSSPVTVCPPCMLWKEVMCHCGSTKKWMSCSDIYGSSSSPSKNTSGGGGASPSSSLPAPHGESEPNVFSYFSCQRMCGKVKNCGRHRCREVCHSGACQPCRRSPADQKFCPCGKVRLLTLLQQNAEDFRSSATSPHLSLPPPSSSSLPLPSTTTSNSPHAIAERRWCTDPIPTCGLPCEKELPCGHLCRRMCHDDVDEEEVVGMMVVGMRNGEEKAKEKEDGSIRVSPVVVVEEIEEKMRENVVDVVDSTGIAIPPSTERDEGEKKDGTERGEMPEAEPSSLPAQNEKKEEEREDEGILRALKTAVEKEKNEQKKKKVAGDQQQHKKSLKREKALFLATLKNRQTSSVPTTTTSSSNQNKENLHHHHHHPSEEKVIKKSEDVAQAATHSSINFCPPPLLSSTSTIGISSPSEPSPPRAAAAAAVAPASSSSIPPPAASLPITPLSPSPCFPLRSCLPSTPTPRPSRKWCACGPCSERVQLPCRCEKKEVEIPCFCMYLPPSQWEAAAMALQLPLPSSLSCLRIPSTTTTSRENFAEEEAREQGTSTSGAFPLSLHNNNSNTNEKKKKKKTKNDHNSTNDTEGTASSCDGIPIEYGFPPHCSTPCRKMLSCHKHRCTETCCIITEHICEKICSKKRNCGKHLCGLLCHAGPCPTCPITHYERLFCSCGKTWTEPPIACGTPLPRCAFPCRIPRPCGHPSAHPCHDPEETACPPCVVPVEKRCGSHQNVMPYHLPCHMDKVACGKKCGKFLSCCHNHCEKPCHVGECKHVCKNPKPVYKEAVLHGARR